MSVTRAVRLPQKQRSKYGATPTVVDGIRFHSAKEARRYGELKLLEKAGEIRALTLQPVYPLHVAGSSAPIKVGVYVADFAYEADFSGGWQDVIEDVKGFKTPLYKWKKRHVEAQYGIEIREI